MVKTMHNNKDPKEQTSKPLILTRGSHVSVKWELKKEFTLYILKLGLHALN